jgi:hypothetical protein
VGPGPKCNSSPEEDPDLNQMMTSIMEFKKDGTILAAKDLSYLLVKASAERM